MPFLTRANLAPGQGTSKDWREDFNSSMNPSNSSEHRSQSPTALIVGLGLVLATFAVYYPVIDNKFIDYDDDDYVTANVHVQTGLTAQNVRWAFTSLTVGNWHPLTMLSLMVDGQFSPRDERTGRRTPALFHLTNLILHCASTFLLFWALLRLTGCLWPSAWVAALFGLHPLHVESVAWVAERKDVLSALFWMLALWTYAGYVRRLELGSRPEATEDAKGRSSFFSTRFAMLAVCLMLALGLLAKPMLVSLPFVLLLLDYWPLGRLSKLRRLQNGGWAKLAWEKAPFLSLAGMFCVITLVAQWRSSAIRSLADISLWSRLKQVPVSYATYIWKMLWPVDLMPHYLLPASGPSAWQACACLLLMAGITWIAWRWRGGHPYLIVGWLWYLVTLVPVIGIVQVGEQAYADRYTYLPLIGPFIMLAWGIPDLVAAWNPMPSRQVFEESRTEQDMWDRAIENPKLAAPHAPYSAFAASRFIVLTGLAIAAVIACSILTRVQVGYWRDDLHLWQHAIQVAPGDHYVHNNLGHALVKERKFDEAGQQFALAIALNRKNGFAQRNLAKVLDMQGRRSEAVRRLLLALDISPDDDLTHILLGRLLLSEDRVHEAVSHFRIAFRLRPENPEGYVPLGEALLLQGNTREAAEVLTRMRNLAPDIAPVHHLLGLALARLHRWQDAMTSLQRAIEIRPDRADYYCDLGLALYEGGERNRADDQYHTASRLQPDWTAQMNAAAGHLLNSDRPAVRQNQRALEMAKEVCQATDFRNPAYLDTLAAAYAATGDSTRARATARKAIDLAAADKQDSLAKQIQERSKKY
jgi:protein O-mannosyl-transferase